jgi:hypothetical protein
MIIRLDLQSERVTPLGSIPGSGLLNSLGRQDIPLHELILREAVQNSWDARLSSNHSIQFIVSASLLNNAQLQLLRSAIIPEVPLGLEYLKQIRDGKKNSVSTLTFSDRGTTGLNGPTRADSIGQPQHRNFINLLRDFGRPKQEENCGGGTYGFGRSALFLASQTRSLIVHSHFDLEDGNIGSRFIVAALGMEYQIIEGDMAGRYTGRHWWGKLTKIDRGGIESLVEPVEGNEADILAAGLGLLPFNQGETGTSIMLLEPECGSMTLESIAKSIAEIIPWYFWPKMFPQTEENSSQIEFRVSYNGDIVEIKNPLNHPGLRYYCQALRTIKDGNLGSYPEALVKKADIMCLKPKRELGRLCVIESVSKMADGDLPDQEVESGVPLSEPQHHVALLRTPELVVKYLRGPSRPDGMEYCGIFKANAAMNDIFARSETPTHNEWVADSHLEKNEQTFVRVAMRRINENLKAWVTPPPNQTGSGGFGSEALGDFSKYLSDLIPGLVNEDSENGGAGKSRVGSASSGYKVRGWKPEMSELPSLTEWHGIKAAQVGFKCPPLEESETGMVEAQISIAVDDGNETEREAPIGAVLPKVLAWIKPSGEEDIGAQELNVTKGDYVQKLNIWRVLIEMPGDVAIGINLTGAIRNHA